MLRVLVGQVCALNKIWLQLLRHMAEVSVYSRKPRSVEDLRQFVIDAFTNLDHDLCTKVCPSVVSRCRECIGAEGLQFEYLS